MDTNQITEDDIQAAADQLRRSETGQAAARDILTFLENRGCSLDEYNQLAVLKLLVGAWQGKAQLVRDALASE